MKDSIKREFKGLTKEDIQRICNSLKDVFKGGVIIENPERYGYAMKNYYEWLNSKSINSKEDKHE